jgi:hypothetical protein
MSRRIGLSKYQAAAPLHKTIGGKPRVAETIDEPPLSSDSEDGNDSGPSPKIRVPKPGPSKKLVCPPSDSSESEPDRRRSIKPTKFKSSKTAEADDKPVTSGKAHPTGANKRKRIKAPDDVSDEGDDGKGASVRPSSSQSDHLRDGMGFTKRKKAVATYGARPKLKAPDEIDSPEKKKSKFRVPEGISESPSKVPPARLKLPDQGDDMEAPSSPLGGKTPESSNKKRTKKKVNIFMTDKQRRRKGTPKEEESRPSSPPAAVFIMPSDLPDEDARERASGGDAEAISLSGEDSDLDSILGPSSPKERKTVAAALPSCPWCGEPVEESLLKNFARGRRLNVSMQTNFCRKHRKQTALKTWEVRKYPTIDWKGFEDRFIDHLDFLIGIVDGKPSHFRTKLANDIDSGKARSVKKEGNLNPGYYGPRGFNIMSDYLVREFGKKLMQRAVDDRVIAGRGSAAFIQSVLVAELGVQLISEDMGVGEEEARDIMEESKAIGDMVNDDV